LVGICSYLLINFWFRRIEANKAAMKALIMNRIGDWGYCIGAYILYNIYGNWDYATIFSLTPLIDKNLLTILSICLFIAAMGKSAQLPLHTWLADAIITSVAIKYYYMLGIPFLLSKFIFYTYYNISVSFETGYQ